MHQAAKIYGRVANDTACARELEASLLLRSAARFQAISENWESRQTELNDALLFNRRLWTIFLDSISRDTNRLPAEIRRNVIGLGLFVINRSMKLVSNPQPDGLNSLININRELAAGLRTA